MRIVVNGEERDLAEGTTIADLVEQSGAGAPRRRGIAVAVDAEVVPQGAWESTALLEGQVVEMLTAIQGG
jgi:sulfur carrier protein